MFAKRPYTLGGGGAEDDGPPTKRMRNHSTYSTLSDHSSGYCSGSSDYGEQLDAISVLSSDSGFDDLTFPPLYPGVVMPASVGPTNASFDATANYLDVLNVDQSFLDWISNESEDIAVSCFDAAIGDDMREEDVVCEDFVSDGQGGNGQGGSGQGSDGQGSDEHGSDADVIAQFCFIDIGMEIMSESGSNDGDCAGATNFTADAVCDEHADIKEESCRSFAGASNYCANTIKMTAGAWKSGALKDFLKGFHCTQQVHMYFKGVKRPKLCGIDDLTKELFEQTFQSNSSIKLTKLPLQTIKKENFVKQNFPRKRAVARCSNLIRGLALADIVKQIEDSGKDKAARNNMFTNFQRSDRKTGTLLAKKYAALHKVEIGQDLEVLEERCNVQLTIFNDAGFVKYFSSATEGEAVQFYETADEYYLVRNLKAFSHVTSKGKGQ